MLILTRTYNLLKKLKPDELKSLRAYLTAFSAVKANEKLIAVKLLDQIVKSNYSLTFDQLSIRVYGKKESDTLKKRLQVLHAKALEMLSLDINLYKDGNSAYTQASVGAKSKLSRAFVIRGRGLLREAELLYDDVIKTAIEFELYNELLDALHMKKSVKSLTYSRKEYEALKKQTDYYEKCRTAFYKVSDYFDRLVINLEYKASGQKMDLLTKAISDVQHDLTNINSANVQFFLSFIKVQYYQEVYQYQQAEKELKSMLVLLKASPAIYVNYRYANVLMNLGENALRYGNYKACISYCAESEKFTPANSYNYSLLKEIEFYAQFNLGEYKKATQLIDEVLFNKLLTTDDFRKSKRYYFKACISFKQKKYKETIEILKNTTEINNDKEGWNIGIRLLEIMSYFEQSNVDITITKKIECLRKHIDKFSKISIVRDRDMLIKEIVFDLEKSSFDFDKTYITNKNNFQKLLSENTSVSWQAKAAELLNFAEWFISHVKNREAHYQPNKLLSKTKRIKLLKDNFVA